jgi:hypothetical protein
MAINRVLPLISNLCGAIDQLFVEEVGPFGQLVVSEAREKWQAAGHRMKTSDIEEYVVLLAREIPESSQRSQFIAKARDLIGQY